MVEMIYFYFTSLPHVTGTLYDARKESSEGVSGRAILSCRGSSICTSMHALEREEA